MMPHLEQTLKWKIGWGVTSLCNMRCSFCYSQTARDGMALVPLTVMKAFVDANHRHIDSINYGTAENTLSEDWYDILKYVSGAYPDIGQALTTNGYLAPAIRMRRDHDAILASLDEVDVSLDFVQAEHHNSFRGHPEAHRWALETIELCRSVGLRTTIVVLGVDDTLRIGNISGIFSLAEKHGCYVRINIFRPSGDQLLTPLSYDVLKSTLLYILGNHAVVSICDQLLGALLMRQRVADASGITSLRILPDGSITPSTYLVAAEWRRAHIKTAFLGGEELRGVLSIGLQTTSQPAACGSCELKEMCEGGAVDRRVIWYGSIDERDPYCPLRHGEKPDNWRIDQGIATKAGPSIHVGYLPTLIFCP